MSQYISEPPRIARAALKLFNNTATLPRRAESSRPSRKRCGQCGGQVETEEGYRDLCEACVCLLFDGVIEYPRTPRREFAMIRRCPSEKRFLFVCRTCEHGFADYSQALALYNKAGVLIGAFHQGCTRACHDKLRAVPLTQVLADLLRQPFGSMEES